MNLCHYWQEQRKIYQVLGSAECRRASMGRTVGIGIQDFEKIIINNYFYVDKTDFIREWWESGDDVILITRPRRFGISKFIGKLSCYQFVVCQY